MLKSYLTLVTKHLNKNKKLNIINIIALTLSLFILALTMSANRNINTIEKSIFNSYINSNVVEISRIKNLNKQNDKLSIIQYQRPTMNEVKNVSYFENDEIFLNLNYLLTDYKIKIDDYVKNISLKFEPHFLDDKTFYYSGFDAEKIELIFNKEILFNKGEESNYETFNFDASTYQFKKTKHFNFLNYETIFYPYDLIKNISIKQKIETLNSNWYQYIKNKDNSSIETNLSLFIKLNNKNIISDFENSKYSGLYQLRSTPIEISKSFSNLISSMFQFSTIFLIIIAVLVFTLIIYSFYYTILQNKKEIALLKSYGFSNLQIRNVFRIEINLIGLLSFIFSLLLIYITHLVINEVAYKTLFITSLLVIDKSIIVLIFLGLFLILNVLFTFPFLLISKVSIREELNSL